MKNIPKGLIDKLQNKRCTGWLSEGGCITPFSLLSNYTITQISKCPPIRNTLEKQINGVVSIFSMKQNVST